MWIGDGCKKIEYATCKPSFSECCAMTGVSTIDATDEDNMHLCSIVIVDEQHWFYVSALLLSQIKAKITLNAFSWFETSLNPGDILCLPATNNTNKTPTVHETG